MDHLVFASDEISYLMKKYDATAGIIILQNPKWEDRPISQYDGNLSEVKKIIDYYASHPSMPFPTIKEDEITIADLKQSTQMLIFFLIFAASFFGILGGIGIAYITLVK